MENGDSQPLHRHCVEPNQGEPLQLVQRIVSGGQTGVDRAALDVALELSIDHGGWCPQGRRSESGSIDARYRLQETPQWSYRYRTEKNIVDSDGTLILHDGPLVGGTELTSRLCRRLGKPLLCVDFQQRLFDGWIEDWIVANDIRELNVAGPRESTRPGIYQLAYDLLLTLFERGSDK